MWTSFELNQFSWYMWTQISKLATFLRSNVLKHVYFFRWNNNLGGLMQFWKKGIVQKAWGVFECLCY